MYILTYIIYIYAHGPLVITGLGHLQLDGVGLRVRSAVAFRGPGRRWRCRQWRRQRAVLRGKGLGGKGADLDQVVDLGAVVAQHVVRDEAGLGLLRDELADVQDGVGAVHGDAQQIRAAQDAHLHRVHRLGLSGWGHVVFRRGAACRGRAGLIRPILLAVTAARMSQRAPVVITQHTDSKMTL